MTELTLELDKNASQSMFELMTYYGVTNPGELIGKALSLLKLAAHVNKTQGKLFARKGDHETQIITQ